MTIQVPIPDFTAARRAMVENQLRPQGVTDRGVIDAMGAIARERFVPDEARPLAYSDRSVPLGNGRSLMPSAVLGLLLTALAPQPGERALVVGAGYSAAVLAAIGLKVIAVESDPALAALAQEHGLEVVAGDLEAGAKARGPFDLILIDGAVELVPDALVAQLADGGRLGGALIEDGVARLIVGRKAGGGFGILSIGDAGVPRLPGFSRPRAFTF